MSEPMVMDGRFMLTRRLADNETYKSLLVPCRYGFKRTDRGEVLLVEPCKSCEGPIGIVSYLYNKICYACHYENTNTQSS